MFGVAGARALVVARTPRMCALRAHIRSRSGLLRAPPGLAVVSRQRRPTLRAAQARSPPAIRRLHGHKDWGPRRRLSHEPVALRPRAPSRAPGRDAPVVTWSRRAVALSPPRGGENEASPRKASTCHPVAVGPRLRPSPRSARTGACLSRPRRAAGGFGAEIAATVAETLDDALNAPSNRSRGAAHTRRLLPALESRASDRRANRRRGGVPRARHAPAAPPRSESI